MNLLPLLLTAAAAARTASAKAEGWLVDFYEGKDCKGRVVQSFGDTKLWDCQNVEVNDGIRLHSANTTFDEHQRLCFHFYDYQDCTGSPNFHTDGTGKFCAYGIGGWRSWKVSTFCP